MVFILSGKESDMKIITIARELGATNRVQENALSQVLGLKMVHREALDEQFRSLKTAPEYIKNFDEKRPGFLNSFSGRPDIYWETLRTAVLREAVKGDVIFIGRGVNFMLEGIADCLRLRLVAPPEYRIRQITRLHKCTPEKAREHMLKSDHEREGFCYYFYGKSWKDSHGYDLTINTAEIDFAEWSKLVSDFVSARKTSYSENMQTLKNELLKQEIRHKLLIVENLEIRFLTISCSCGNVILKGDVLSRGVFDRVEKCLKQIDGINHLDNRLQVVMNDIPLRME